MKVNTTSNRVSEGYFKREDGTPVITADFAISDVLQEKISALCEKRLGDLGYKAKDWRNMHFTVSESGGLLSVNCIYPGILPADKNQRMKDDLLVMVEEIVKNAIGFIH